MDPRPPSSAHFVWLESTKRRGFAGSNCGLWPQENVPGSFLASFQEKSKAKRRKWLLLVPLRAAILMPKKVPSALQISIYICALGWLYEV